jgi:hypothetical protein
MAVFKPGKKPEKIPGNHKTNCQETESPAVDKDKMGLKCG